MGLVSPLNQVGAGCAGTHLHGCLENIAGSQKRTQIFDFYLILQFLFHIAFFNTHFLKKKKGIKIGVKFEG